ncbi:MAG TPA: ATP-binding cassette domain-containing protein, partial [Thermomicrobiales bacterium]|nr:ATP-binding cassette domain-containing protein [Thermomicrobiales bacterium]
MIDSPVAAVPDPSTQTPAGAAPVVVAEHLSKHFKLGGELVQAIDDIDLSLPRGKMIALRGQSGSGKSTLLGLFGALDSATSGTLTVDGVVVTSLRGSAEVDYRRRKTGFIFQSFNLIPYLTALENVMLPLELVGESKTRQIERARELLKRVGIAADRQLHRPTRL